MPVRMGPLTGESCGAQPPAPSSRTNFVFGHDHVSVALVSSDPRFRTTLENQSETTALKRRKHDLNAKRLLS